ncbi:MULTISPECIES: hypothetical protein [unclassified Mesorhizobium]|uniref:hypothetical protein n=1 Tax=unclassified Mesorhizobium TaxID=325217 RepID=UPI000FDAC6F5|nr:MULTISPECIES: hypothetical protein [unclassified Mesorhizobium]TGT71813.1 hypothetical protein EN809_016680 [Mesorhizobium sp. M2E.F.Ca.ET.166.01.1.1]TGV99473.1 hypothetical protein EN797_024575 [Mesorhizobium sp. M2E.F.Ca.ET.154.01.1.1]
MHKKTGAEEGLPEDKLAPIELKSALAEKEPATVEPKAAAAEVETAITAEGEQSEEQSSVPWGELKVAVIDDAMQTPHLALLSNDDAAAVERLLTENNEVVAELNEAGCDAKASADVRLRFLAESDSVLVSIGLVGDVSAEALRMIEEHRAFRRLIHSLEQEVATVLSCDPFQDVPDLTTYNLVLLDYYLEGPAKGGERAVSVATAIRSQHGRPEEQQIVLMSSLESVRDLRGAFRTKTDITGSAFAFVGKSDLNEPWKVKAHLGMLERARPYAPAFTQYRSKLDDALTNATKGLLELVDDLDIGDYAFLQSRALMKDGHPLGDYVFWLLSSQLMALAFEQDEMRERQRALDTLEFVGETFAATEPSTVVANLLHSALVSRNMGPLGPHPRAKPDSKYTAFPLVQLGDVFFDPDRTKAIVVMSADCDLAFSPLEDREPESETPVMLVPGTPIKLKDASENNDAKTDGVLHREEVYRIVWKFAKYRSVELGKLEAWLKSEGYDVSNRDRLRPLFGLKLQQEFGAHLLRVGPPIIPPMTTPAKGRIFVCSPDRNQVRQFDSAEIMLTRFKGTTWLRVTPTIAGALKDACEDLLDRLLEKHDAAKDKAKADLARKMEALERQLLRDEFWINLLNGVELNAVGRVKADWPLGFVLGSDWADPSKPSVVLEIAEEFGRTGEAKANDTSTAVEDQIDVAAVSAAG